MADILYNIKKVVLSELDPTTGLIKASNPIICTVTTADSAELDPVISNGEEKMLRSDENILAIARTPDLLYGYNLKLKDNTFDVNVGSLIEGGVIRRDGGMNIIGYDSPKLADGATMKPFQAEIYIANYERDSIKNYVKVTLTNCVGKAPKLGFKKEFFAPEFEIKARENTLAGKPIKTIDYVSSLPTDDTTAPTLTRNGSGSITIPASYTGKLDELGYIYIVPASATVTTLSHLANLVAVGMGKVGTMLSAGTDISIATTGLSAGSYKVYGVDTVGNVSAGQALTLA
jgi:hypothetical protein